MTHFSIAEHMQGFTATFELTSSTEILKIVNISKYPSAICTMIEKDTYSIICMYRSPLTKL